MEKVGEFRLKMELFHDNGTFSPNFVGLNINMPKEVLMAQLKAFLKNIEDDYNDSFKNNTPTISGKPDN